MPYNKSLKNPYSHSQASNSSSDMYNHTMTNILDAYYDWALNSGTDGIFPAVCLSGINTEDGTGAGTEANDAIDSGEFMKIIVRPLTIFGDILPDPRGMTDANIINQVISMHGATFMARSDFNSKDTDPIKFGQVIDCYFEKGSIVKSDFRTLRFKQPNGSYINNSFWELSTITGIQTIASADWSSASLLSDNSEETNGEGKCTNIKGDRKEDITHIVIHYSAATGGKKSVLSYENKNTEFGYHYMIDRDGSHYDSAPPEKIVWHAAGNNSIGNKNSVGICIMNVGFERDGVSAKQNWVSGKFPNSSNTAKWEPYTEASINKLVEICADLIIKYPKITTNNIVGHSDIQSNKSDPGPAFNFEDFRAKVARKVSEKKG